MVETELHRRRRGRNYALLIVLFAFVLLSAAVAVVKMPQKVQERQEMERNGIEVDR